MTEHPDLPALNDAIEKSKRWMEAVASITDGLQFETSARKNLSVTLHHLSIEHHSAIHTLIDLHVWGSAFALFRPQFEAYVRGYWYCMCAKDEDIEKFHKDGEPPRFPILVEQLEATGIFGGSLKSFAGPSWSRLCSFTHGGAMQTSNRTTNNEIVSNYRLKDMQGLLEGSDALALGACSGIAQAILDDSLSVKAREAYYAIHGSEGAISSTPT